mmetsp:Transcript_20016/g.34446  ORF Transcript_20016/g.34446 Transcript_20016/m.34446 type:complete len:200 (+) Transcript_20016:1145-1744(+)
MIPITRPRGQRSIQSWNPRIRVGRRRTVPLHINQPRRGTVFVRHSQRLPQPFRHVPRAKIGGFGRFVLLPLVVEIAKRCHVGRFCLMLEKCFVQGAIIDVHPSPPTGHPHAVLLLHGHFALVLGRGIAHVANPRLDDEVRQRERRLFDAALPLQILPFAPPVPRDGDGPDHPLQIHQEIGIGGRDVVGLDEFGVGYALF